MAQRKAMREYIKNKFLKESDKAAKHAEDHDEEHHMDDHNNPDGEKR